MATQQLERVDPKALRQGAAYRLISGRDDTYIEADVTLTGSLPGCSICEVEITAVRYLGYKNAHGGFDIGDLINVNPNLDLFQL